MDNIENSKIIFLCGTRGSGKTVAIRYILYKNMKRLNFGLVFSGTAFNRKNYDYIDKKYIINGFNEQIFENYLQGLEKYANKYGKCPFNFLVFDDLLGVLTNMTPRFKQFLGNSRHYNTLILFATQYLRSKIPVLRELTDYGLFFHSNRHDTIKALYEEFGTMFESYDDFKEHFFKVTDEKYCAMFYDREKKLNDNYLCFKAPNVENIKVKMKF